MNKIEELERRWSDSVRFRPVHAALWVDKGELLLGAGTALAGFTPDGALALDGEETRVLTLLSVAHGSPMSQSVLRKLRAASVHARAGNQSMAAMHMALAVPTLRDPADAARRLFIADGLMSAGVSPREIWTALQFDPALLNEMEKLYNPDQPRVPAGDGRTSGQWTSEGYSLEVETLLTGAAQIAAERTGEGAVEREWWEPILEIAPRLAAPLAFFNALLYSTPAGGERRGGKVPGRPDLAWTEDEGLVTVTRESDGQIVLQAKRGPDGKIRLTRAVQRLLNEHAGVDPALLPPVDPRSDQRDKEPRICPRGPTPDAPQGSARSWAYSDYAKMFINQPPTPPKFGYQLPNPFDGGKVVLYDDCQRNIGMMIEIKGYGYARLLQNATMQERIKYAWLSQATRQIEASGTRPVCWIFAEKSALAFARQLFSDPHYKILNRIKLVYLPMLENEK